MHQRGWRRNRLTDQIITVGDAALTHTLTFVSGSVWIPCAVVLMITDQRDYSLIKGDGEIFGTWWRRRICSHQPLWIKVSDLCGEFDRKPTCFLSVLSFDWLFGCGNISGPCMHMLYIKGMPEAVGVMQFCGSEAAGNLIYLTNTPAWMCLRTVQREAEPRSKSFQRFSYEMCQQTFSS